MNELLKSKMRPHPLRHYTWFYAFILIAAFVLRAHQLTHYPPAINTDEAVNVIDAFHIIHTGNFPLYEEDQGRPEPLYQLVLAGGVALWGSSVWGMRLISIFLSLLTIATLGWVTRQVLRDLPDHTRHIGAAGAMIALTVMIGDLTLSRTLFRTNLELLCGLLSMGFVLRALASLRRRDFILGGLLGGLVLYTYTSGWAFPIGFIGLGITLLLFQRRQWRRWLPGMLLLTVCAAVIVAPVVFLALTYPRAVFGRAQSVLGGRGSMIDLALRAARQFFEAGDANPEYNVGNAPIISAAFLPLFLIGLAALFARIRTQSSLFLLCLLVAFNLPVVLSNELPHGLRVASEYVIVATIIGVGIGIIFTAFRYVPLLRTDPARVRVALLALISLMLLHGQFAWNLYQDFWQQPGDWQLWKVYGYTLNHNEWFFRADRDDFAHWLNAQTTPILIPVDELQEATTRTWLLPTYPTVITAGDDFRLPAQTKLVIPWSLPLNDYMTETTSYALLSNGVITLLPPLAQPTHAALISLMAGGEPISRTGQLSKMGIVAALPESFQIAFASAAVSDSPVASFAGDELRLQSWYGNTTIAPNDTQMPVTLMWSPQRRIGHVYAATLQLLTQDYRGISETNHLTDRWLYPSTIWQLGDVIPDSFLLPLPPSLVPGGYRLALALYFASYPLLPAASIYPSDLNDKATIGWIKVPQTQPVHIPATATPINATIADAVSLDAVAIQRGTDGMCTVELFWRGLVERPAFDATIFVHLADSSGKIIAQNDRRPWDGQYPTLIWGKDEIVQTNHSLACGDLSAETLSVGMYTFPGPQNLPAALDDTALPDGVIPLGSAERF
jgi:hypothetical protein